MSYSFLRESKLYIVYGGNKYRIYTSSSLTFNQTFAEESYTVKTLHDQSKMFEGSIINKANPASFSFDVPLTTEKDESIILDLACDLVENTGDPESSASDRHDAEFGGTEIETQQLKSFDMYVQTENTTWKLESAIITSATLDFIPSQPFTLRLEGEGTKLTRAGTPGSYTIPGSLQSESATRTPLIVYPFVSVGGSTVENIMSCNLQIQNEIEWLPYENLHNSLTVTNSSDAMFPSDFTLGNRIVSGEIRQYHTEDNYNDHSDFSTSVNLQITGKKVSNDTSFFKIEINPAMYTSRVNPESVYTTSYDFRSLDNTGTLDDAITLYPN
jgi:hypothetical protein